MKQEVRKRSQTKEIQSDQLAAALVSKLQRAGINGLTLTGLGLRSGTQRRKIAVASLRDLALKREIVGIGTKGRERWIHRGCLEEWLSGEAPKSLSMTYQSLVDRDGITDIPILQLLHEAGVPLDSAKKQLTELAEQGRVILSRGDWSLASEEEKNGAIDWFGQPHLRIRYV